MKAAAFLLAGILSCVVLARDEEKSPAFEEFLKTTEAQAEAVLSECAHLPKTPLQFSANLTLAYGSVIKDIPDEALLGAATAFKEAGVQRIDFNPSQNSLSAPEAMKKYEALIRHIRELGLKMAINPEFEGHDKMSLKEFEEISVKADVEWCSRFHPDHFVVVHEPTTMDARMGIETTPAEWRGFVEATARAVKKASPETRVGAGCFAGLSNQDVPYFEEFAKIPELEFLTIDNYIGTKEAIERMDKMAKCAHEAHKPVYMEETWRPHFVEKGAHHERGASIESESAVGYGCARFEELDRKWLRAMAAWAATHGMETMTPFQTKCLFRYVDSPPWDGPGYDKEVAKAIEKKERTRTYEAYKEIIREFGAR